MSDDKSTVGAQDRSRIPADEPYEFEYFARKHGLTEEQARKIIEEHGPDREACERAASRQHARLVLTLEERHTLRERFQAVEDDLLAAGKRHATIEGVEGLFKWFAIGAERESPEPAEADDIQEIEDMIVGHGRHKTIQVATKAGTFIWRSRS